MDALSKRDSTLTRASSRTRERFSESPSHWSRSRVEIIRSYFNLQAKTLPALHGNTPHRSPDLPASCGNLQSFHGRLRQHSINPEYDHNPHCAREQFFGDIGHHYPALR